MKKDRPSRILTNLSLRLDPMIGEVLTFRRKISSELNEGRARLFLANAGMLAAGGLYVARNFFAKMAVRLYHISRKASAGVASPGNLGEPKSSPSFFLKAVMSSRGRRGMNRSKE
jgi:hypothetical protein